MLKVDAKTRSLTQLSPTTLSNASILERDHLQEAILRSWDAFCGELGFEELFLVGSEVEPHPSCRDRIDILALDGDGRPVIFELKRHRDKLQLLQAISYAAMIAKWTKEDFLRSLPNESTEPVDEVRALLDGDQFQLQQPTIVLLAESFDPEVILAADWLSQFEIDIRAFSMSSLEHREETFISVDQRFPLLGVDDLYVGRSKRRKAPPGDNSWEEVLKEVTFPFARRALDVFRKQSNGAPERKCFYSIYSASTLGRMRIIFRRDYLKIYTRDQSPKAEKTLRDTLGAGFDIATWGSEKTQNSGFTFKIATADQLEAFVRAVGEK